MVGASSRRTPRLPLTKGTRDRNAVEKRWWPARRIFPISGAVLSTCSREHRRVYLRALFSSYLPAKSRRYARSDLHPAEHKPGPRLPFSELGMSEAQPPGALPSPGAACAGGAPNRPRPRVRAVRPARGNPWGRSGRLHAPEAARTGPVNALRRYSSWSPPARSSRKPDVPGKSRTENKTPRRGAEVSL